MKVWQKIYLVAFIISVVFVNLGIYAVFHLTYQKSIKTEETSGQTSYHMLEQIVENNFNALESRQNLNEDTINELMQMYEKEYSKQSFELLLWKNGKKIYPENESKADKEDYILTEDDIIATQIYGKRWNKSFRAVGKVKGLEDDYRLCMKYPLKGLNDTWKKLHKIYLMISIAMMAVMAVLLNLFLHIFLRPLEYLDKQANEIREGNYQSRVDIKGKDEIAGLGESLNTMAEKIQQNIEELQNENEKKEELIENLAHEMKSPLTSIYGYAEFLQKAPITEDKAQEFYQIIMDESKRLQDMAYALMDLAELRGQKIDMEEFRVKSFIDKQRHIVDKKYVESDGAPDSIREKDRKVTWVDKTGENDNIYGNSQLISILTLNLISNASRAVQEREDGTVKVEIEKIENGNIKLSISDNGIGIPKEKLNRITEPFYRVDKGRSRSQGGNGLGLALCKRIVELHNAKMNIISREGEGTTVEVEFWRIK